MGFWRRVGVALDCPQFLTRFLQLDIAKFAVASVLPFIEYERLDEADCGHCGLRSAGLLWPEPVIYWARQLSFR
jgi:hypothetical protein